MTINREILSADAVHTDDWHAARAQGIGGSDIASIVGAGYRSPYATWLGKTQPDSTGNLQMRRGNALEPIVADEFEQEPGSHSPTPARGNAPTNPTTSPTPTDSCPTAADSKSNAPHP